MRARMTILGHRGEGVTNRDPAVAGKKLSGRTDPYYHNEILPENSLSAFKHAIEHGADGIECDVYVSKDDVPMVIHDNQLARNVDGFHFWGKDKQEDILGQVSDFTCEELQSKFTIGKNEAIPTLHSVIKLLAAYNHIYKTKQDRNLTVNIELKGGARTSRATYEVVMGFVKDSNGPFDKKDFLFNSFEQECVAEMKKLDSEMRCALGISTNDLYNSKIKMPGWVPLIDHYPENTTSFLMSLINRLNLDGLDVVTSDAKETLLEICVSYNLFLNAATNSLRLRIEAEDKKSSDARLTDFRREKKEVARCAYYSAKYATHIFYKADNPGAIKKFYGKILRNEEIAKTEKIVAEQDLRQCNVDRETLQSFVENMRVFQEKGEGTHLGRTIARVYCEVAEEMSSQKGKEKENETETNRNPRI